MTEKFIIGTIGAPFGVKGFVKIRSGSGEIDHLLKLKSVIISKDEKERLLQIEESKALTEGSRDSAILLRFAGFDSPEAVKTLTGAQLLVSRDQAAPLKDGEFYIEDLKGLPVTAVSGEIIGNITDIIEGGGGELAEIQLIGGEKRLIPFKKEFFTEIIPDKGKIVLDNLWILE